MYIYEHDAIVLCLWIPWDSSRECCAM